jgi:hypothetical protein
LRSKMEEGVLAVVEVEAEGVVEEKADFIQQT